MGHTDLGKNPAVFLGGKRERIYKDIKRGTPKERVIQLVLPSLPVGQPFLFPVGELERALLISNTDTAGAQFASTCGGSVLFPESHCAPATFTVYTQIWPEHMLSCNILHFCSVW